MGRTTLTREKVRERIARYVELYGEPPRAADLNPSAAKWSGQLWRADRYRLGDPETGEPWPSLNSVKKLYGGSLNAAVVDAGFRPHKPGPPRRKDVDPMLAREQMTPAAQVALDGAMARVRELEEYVAVRDRQLARVRGARTVAPTRERAVRTITVSDERLALALRKDVARLEREAREAALALSTARADRDEARTSAKRAASALERREAVLRDVRDQKREALSRARVLERRVEGLVASLADARKMELKPKTEVVYRDAPERVELEAARARAEADSMRAVRAQVAQAEAEAAYRELAAAVTGEPRRLSSAEVAGLRRKGPAGPVVLTAAMRKVALARRSGGPVLQAALRELAAAAISWAERVR